MLGLEDGAHRCWMLIALKRLVCLDPDTTFSALHQEALLLEEVTQSPRWPEATSAAVRWPHHYKSHQQADSWKQELKREIVEELKYQLKDFACELIRELRQASSVPIHHNSAPQPRAERRYQQPHSGNRWDEGGRPI